MKRTGKTIYCPYAGISDDDGLPIVIRGYDGSSDCYGEKCKKCGWNPEVNEKRIEKIRSAMKDGSYWKEAKA